MKDRLTEQNRTEQNRTEHSNDLLSFRSRNEVSETNGYSNDPSGKGLERNGNILFKRCDSSGVKGLNGNVHSARFLGSLLNQGPGFAGAVFDKNYLCPTITTCGGGGREPHIVMEMEDE